MINNSDHYFFGLDKFSYYISNVFLYICQQKTLIFFIIWEKVVFIYPIRKKAPLFMAGFTSLEINDRHGDLCNAK